MDVVGQPDQSAAALAFTDGADGVLSWRYDWNRPQLAALYEKSAASQWVGAELDWDRDVDLDRVASEQHPLAHVVRRATQLPGSPIARWGEREIARLTRENFAARLSEFLHGEQGAMLTAAKLVEAVPWMDAKLTAATQAMDEARHTEVFARYITTKVGSVYPMGPYLHSLVLSVLEDSRWDVAYLGMQVVIESLGLAAFGDMLRRTSEPLLASLLRAVMADEGRHVAFGLLTLGEYYAQLSAAELRERQDFLAEATASRHLGSVGDVVWSRFGIERRDVAPYLAQASAEVGGAAPGVFKVFLGRLIPNVRKLGLLDANDGYLRRRWERSGLLAFEHAAPS
ncbi:MAG TPA: ferritin-like domain-containing protein [Acidimicrobiales bacterium]|nr:ferritin-like domain-containing protein [Acidimicrobiales bacterium]